VATIETLKAIEREGQRPTPQEQRTLARYVGWGGPANAFPHPQPRVGPLLSWRRMAPIEPCTRSLPGPTAVRITSSPEMHVGVEQFAETSGFSQQYISGLERGHRNPTVITLYELAVALGVSHLDLLRPQPRGRAQGGGARPTWLEPERCTLPNSVHKRAR